MTKKHGAKAKGIVEKKNLSAADVLELQEMLRLINARKFEAAQVKANTALIPRGQEVANELEAIARLLDNAKNSWVARKLIDCGYKQDTKCNINLSTGEIEVTVDKK